LSVCPTTILNQYSHLGESVDIEKLTDGLINSTFKVRLKKADVETDYVFQCLNPYVFPKPKEVMENVVKITQHLKTHHPSPTEQQLSLFSTNNTQDFAIDSEGNYWRCYNFISASTTYNTCESPQFARSTAFAFGQFTHLLSTFPTASLHTTLPDFHCTPKYLKKLLEVIDHSPPHLTTHCKDQIDFILKRENICHRLELLKNEGKLPLRATHNDTKINNVLFHTKTLQPLCVIDLDTVMPGLVAYDFGDLVRTMICSVNEESTKLEDIAVRSEYFKSLAHGFIEGCPTLNNDEIDSLAIAGTVITLELSIRFLIDHLQGDLYFQTDRKNHNLDRCRNQQRLVELLEKSEPEFNETLHSFKKPKK